MLSRIFATLILSIAFGLLLVTGVLLYSTPYDYLTSSLHTWAAIILTLSLSFHLYNNWNVYTRHLSKRVGKITFGAALIAIIPLTYAIVVEKWPVTEVLTFGENLRSSGAVRDGEFELVDLAGGGNKTIRVFIKAGTEYRSDPKPLFLGFTYTATPQIAIWLESVGGEFLKTIYLTNKISNSGFRLPSLNQTTLIRRPEALPYWGHRRGVKSADGLFIPEAGSTAFDGLTAPTPRGDHQLILPQPFEGKVRLLLEVNRSYDFNDYYSRTRFPDDPVYSGDGSSGQPSLIYEALIDTNSHGRHLFKLIGHGHHSGKNGLLFTDLNRISTAREILDFVVATVN